MGSERYDGVALTQDSSVVRRVSLGFVMRFGVGIHVCWAGEEAEVFDESEFG